MKNKNLIKVGYHIWSMVFALAIVLAILTLSISLNSKDLTYYHDFQVKNQIDKITGRSQDELDIINEDTALYLELGHDKLLENHYNQKEISHMRDVYKLYELNRKIFNISITFIIITLITNIIFKNRHKINKNTLYYILFIIVASLIFVFLVSKDFNKYFVKFHEIFFDNDLWLLDPETDLMIQMMPLEFFIGMAKKIFINFAFGLCIVIFILILDSYFNKNNKRCLLCNLKVVG